MKVVIMSAPGRELVTLATIENIERQNPGEPFAVYRTRNHPVWSFYEILRGALVVDNDGIRFDDVLFLEDDIVTARNFIRYARELPTRFATSFFNVKRLVIGEAVSATGFAFSQAIKFPGAVVAKLVTAAVSPRGQGTDDEVGTALAVVGEPVVYHRSLVQHVGDRSIAWGPEKTLDHRAAVDYVGDEFDCMTLLKCTFCNWCPDPEHPTHDSPEHPPTIGDPGGLLGTRAETAGASSERRSTGMGCNSPGGHITNLQLFGPMCRRCGHGRSLHNANGVCCAVVPNEPGWIAPLGNSDAPVCDCRRFRLMTDPPDRAVGKTCSERNADLFYCTLDPGHEWPEHVAHDKDGVVRARWPVEVTWGHQLVVRDVTACVGCGLLGHSIENCPR